MGAVTEVCVSTSVAVDACVAALFFCAAVGSITMYRATGFVVFLLLLLSSLARCAAYFMRAAYGATDTPENWAARFAEADLPIDGLGMSLSVLVMAAAARCSPFSMYIAVRLLALPVFVLGPVLGIVTTYLSLEKDYAHPARLFKLRLAAWWGLLGTMLLACCLLAPFPAPVLMSLAMGLAVVAVAARLPEVYRPELATNASWSFWSVVPELLMMACMLTPGVLFAAG